MTDEYDSSYARNWICGANMELEVIGVKDGFLELRVDIRQKKGYRTEGGNEVWAQVNPAVGLGNKLFMNLNIWKQLTKQEKQEYFG